MMHLDTVNSQGHIHSGNLINRSVQVAYLSVLELCELSMKEDNKIPDAAVLSTKIQQVSIDNVGFAHPILVGDVLSLKAKIIYVDTKKGLAYV